MIFLYQKLKVYSVLPVTTLDFFSFHVPVITKKNYTFLYRYVLFSFHVLNLLSPFIMKTYTFMYCLIFFISCTKTLFTIYYSNKKHNF